MHFRDRTDVIELLILFSSIMKLGIVLFDSQRKVKRNLRLFKQRKSRNSRQACSLDFHLGKRAESQHMNRHQFHLGNRASPIIRAHMKRPSVNKHFIMWPPRFSFFPFFFFSGNRNVHLVAHFNRKVRIYIATRLFQFASCARY